MTETRPKSVLRDSLGLGLAGHGRQDIPLDNQMSFGP